MVIIWYLIAEFEDDNSPISEAISQYVLQRFADCGFHIHCPVNANAFTEVLQNLPVDDMTLLHIVAHGSNSQLAPFNQRELNRMRQEGAKIDIDDYLISYQTIMSDLNNIYPAHHLILNLMSVCYSHEANPPATITLTVSGENDNISESLSVYPLNTDVLVKQINALNLKRTQTSNEPYHIEYFD
jgi:hypothetical protein